jgi:hypothetical protein
MNYNKPYKLWPSSVPYRHYMLFPTEERNTDSYIFTYGRKLPFKLEGSNYTKTLQDPIEYDLVYLSKVEPEIFMKYDFLPTDKSALVVNKKVKHILSELCPDDVQFFEATIVPENSKKMTFENHDYWVLNLTKTVDVIDEEHSVFERWEDGDLKNIKKVTYIENRMANIQIGRQKTYLSSVILSPELVKRFKAEKITGVKFLKDCDYNG